MRRAGWWLVVLALAACEPTGQTTTPDGDGALERMEGTSTPDPTADGAGGPNAATDKPKVLPKVRDRDPEEEKKKMALSRQRSGEARKMLAAGRLAEALDHSRQALKIHEQNVDAMLVMAEAYYRQEKFELVQAVTSSALSVDAKIRSPQETSRAHNLKGFAYTAMGNDNLATQSFRKAAEADEKNASAWNNLGTRYMQAGDVATAKQCFTYALELQPRLAKAHLNLGAALRAEGKWQDAEKSLQAALKLRPNWAEAFFNLGVLYLDADPYPGLETVARLNKAIQYLTKYRELAVADGPSGPAKDPSAGIARTGGKHRKGPAPGPAAVSKDRAEDYIRVAKKGIEREERKAERERARAKKPGESATTDKAPADGASTTGGAAATKPDASKPDASKPDASKPAVKPEASKPGASKPDAKPDASTPVTPTKPSSPTPTKPSSPAPTTPPTSGTGGTPTPPPKSPTPTAPQAPKAPSPQAPKTPPTQSPKPQQPSPKSASLHGPHDGPSWAWNPRDAADTHRAGASDTMLVVVRDAAASTQRRSSPALREGQRGASQRENQCDRGCTSARRIAVRDLDDHTHETAASEYHPRIVAIASHPTPRGVSSPQERA